VAVVVEVVDLTTHTMPITAVQVVVVVLALLLLAVLLRLQVKVLLVELL
jgi:hypothetical protein